MTLDEFVDCAQSVCETFSKQISTSKIVIRNYSFEDQTAFFEFETEQVVAKFILYGSGSVEVEALEIATSRVIDLSHLDWIDVNADAIFVAAKALMNL